MPYLLDAGLAGAKPGNFANRSIDSFPMQQKVKLFYDGLAGKYDAEQAEFAFIRKPEMETALAAVKQVARRTDQVLEIGVGTGRFALQIAPQVGHLTGVDISEDMLAVLEQKAAELSISNITARPGDFLSLPFDTRYDLIVSFSALEYIADKQALFAKIATLLNPGGQLLVTTVHNTFFRWWGRLGNYFRQGIFMQAYGRREIRRLLAANGMRELEIRDLGMRMLFFRGIMLFVHAEKN
jgi:ubiquinone/menaquinone biosynthesis C-methylase UbiE